MNRQEKRHKYTANEVMIRESQAVDTGFRKAASYIYAVTLKILHDKFGFGAKRCKAFLEDTNFQVECVKEGRVSYEDLKELVKNELDIDLQD